MISSTSTLTPSIENVRQSRNRMDWEFYLKGVDTSFANALRRTLISETPKLSIIEEVEFIENSSMLHDEMIAHRLGLIPLTCVNIDNYVFKDDCDCEFICEKCTVVLNIDVKNDDEQKKIVTSLDMTSETVDVMPFLEKIKIKRKDKASEVYEPGITIIHLREGERLAARCFARKDIGSTNAQFSPVTTATYTYEDVDPTQEGPTTFHFRVHTDGCYSAKKAVQIALKTIQNKLLKFSNELNFIR